AAGAAGGLGRHADFVRLWSGTLVSLFGSQISALAVPLTAVVVLGAGPREMGVLSATRWVPYLLFGLVAGVWVDRVRRRPLMIWTDVARAAVVATIPAAALLGVLRIEHLFVAAFWMGALSLVFDAGYQAYLPSLVRREALVEGNARLELARSAAQIGGPSLAGVLVQVVTAPLALLFDAASYVVSAAALARIRTAEGPSAVTERRSVRREVGEGLRWVFGSPLLRPIVLNNVSRMLAASAMGAVYVLYATRELELPPVVLGLVMAAGGPGALLASVTAPRIIGRLGPGPVLVMTFAAEGFFALVVPAAAWLPRGWAQAGVLGAHQLTVWYLLTAGSVAEISLRQAITPARLQGRMNTTMRSLNWGTVAIGALVGGVLGEQIGLRGTQLCGALWMIAASGWSVFSPLRLVREMPSVSDAAEPHQQ
ncbi:MAG TPA: MFS transporter, partial [Chloroflexota bacterium]|nr:MFS transporter [Chloroflexota bacterium]